MDVVKLKSIEKHTTFLLTFKQNHCSFGEIFMNLRNSWDEKMKTHRIPLAYSQHSSFFMNGSDLSHFDVSIPL